VAGETSSASDRPPTDLKRTAPLLDPLKFVLYLLWGDVIFVGIPALVLATTQGYPSNVINLILLSFSFFAIPAFLIVLVQCQQGTPVFYLRSFRSDTSTMQLRAMLRAVLGPQHRLTGIRPPARRSAFVVRVLFMLREGFRSIGSPWLELEAADDDWMLRLLASYRKARFVFIDVRDLTPLVETEIRLSYLAFGVERCVFVTGETRTVEHWRKIVSATVGDQTISAASLMLLPYPGDSGAVAALAARLGEFLKQIPQGTAAIRPEAIAFATSLQSRGRTRFLDTELGRLLGTFAIFSLFGFAIGFFNTELAPGPNRRIYPQIGGILGVLVWCMAFVGFFAAVWRTRRQAKFEKAHQSDLRRTISLWPIRTATLLGIVGVCLFLITRLKDTIYDVRDVIHVVSGHSIVPRDYEIDEDEDSLDRDEDSLDRDEDSSTDTSLVPPSSPRSF
jgi:hypothetical protein